MIYLKHSYAFYSECDSQSLFRINVELNDYYTFFICVMCSFDP